MRLLSVELENLKSYAEPTVIELEAGVNALVGLNGAGKSTVLEAIGAALFNYLPYNHADFVRRGAASGRILVKLLSKEDGRQYDVVRVVGKNPAWYVFDPDLMLRLEEGEHPVSRWIVDHLRLKPGGQSPSVYLRTLFLDSIGPPQGTFTAPFLDNPTDRKNKFNRLLRVAEYEEAWNKLKDTRAELENRRLKLDGEVGKLLVETGQLPATRADLAAQQARRAELEQRGNDLGAGRAAADLRLAVLERAQQALAFARQRHQAQEAALQSATLRLESADLDLGRAEEAARIVGESRAGAEFHQAALRRAGELEVRQREREALRQQELALREEAQRGATALATAASRLEEAESDQARLNELEPALALQDQAEQARDQAQRAVADLEAIERGLVSRQEAAIAADRELEAVDLDLRERRAAARDAGKLEPAQVEIGRLREALGVLRGQADRLREATVAREIAAEQAERLALEEAEIVAELARLDAVRPLAAVSAERRSSHDELRAGYFAAERDLDKLHATRKQVEGGLCPFFAEACKNVGDRGEGLTLESYFDGEISVASRALGFTLNTLDQARRMLDEAQEADRLLGGEAAIRARLTAKAQERARAVRDRDEQAAREREFGAAPEQLRDAEARAAALERDLPALQRAAERAGGMEAVQRALAPATHRARQARVQLEQDQLALRGQAAARAALAEARARLDAIGDARGQAEALRARARQASGLRDQVRRLELQRDVLSDRLVALGETLAPFAEVDTQLGAAQAERDRTRPHYERFIANQDEAAQLEQRRQARALLHDEWTRQQVLLDTARQAMTVAEAAYDPDLHDGTRQERERLGNELAAATTQLEHAGQEILKLEAEITRLEALERQCQQLQSEVAELAMVAALTDRLRGHVRAAGPRIAETMLQRVSGLATLIFGEVMGDASGQLEWRAKDYEVVLRQRGQERVFKQLSGGEQMSAALAVRMAMLRIFAELDIAFLDEPTTNMDDTRRANLARQLKDLPGFEQMVVISHDDAFDGVYGRVTHISKVNGASKVEATV